MIFRITLTGGDPELRLQIQWFFEAANKRKALRKARSELGDRGFQAEEWRHCMAPQHAEIPTVPNLEGHARQCEPAITVHDGVPFCAICHQHMVSDLDDRLERLERAFCELLDDFNRRED